MRRGPRHGRGGGILARVKAITVLQPWASLILSGEKRVENRSWATAHRGPLAIHAGKGRVPDAPDDAPRGVVLGTVTLADCVTLSELRHKYPELRDHPHAVGPFCWVLSDPRPFARPVPAVGKQRFWEWHR